MDRSFVYIAQRRRNRNGASSNRLDGPMQRLVAEGQIAARRHRGFWQCMDTLRDKAVLEAYWASDEPPWKIWD